MAKKNKKGFISEFKEFVMRGNVMDMAIGVVIGTSFGKITTSLVNDVIMPALGGIIGEIDLSQLNFTMVPAVTDAAGNVTKEAVVIGLGTFLVTVIDFLIIAFVIFAMIKAFAKAKEIAEAKLLKAKEEIVEEEAKAPTTEELLTEILAEIKAKKE
ncbi:MAG: large conductance mechanosensitive channel protein MscL [Acutalibacteraceae bacterium]|nr:large conductance mechanosensitive channel protein MscL [Acutalibacteraceae bacterium]